VTKKYPLYIGILVIVALVQELGLSHLTLYNVSPDIVTIFLAFISITIGQKAGTSFGFAAGLLTGILSGNMGLNMLARTIEGFIAGFFNIPEDSHATAKQITKRIYGAIVTAGFVPMQSWSQDTTLSHFLQLTEYLFLDSLNLYSPSSLPLS